MALDGYKSPTSVDVTWWLERIREAETFRERVAFTKKWDTWRAFYRGQFHPSVMPVNLFFVMMRTIVPRIYFRNPSMSIAPAKPGLENAIFAKVLERADNKIMQYMKVKKQMRKVIANAFMFGTGFAKIGFGGIYSPAARLRDDIIDKEGNLVEFNDTTRMNMPWVLSAHPGDTLVESELTSFEYGRWVAHKITRFLEDVKADERLDKKARRELKPTVEESTARRMERQEVTDRLVDLYEIRDRKTNSVFVIACQTQKEGTVLLQPQPDSLQSSGMLPIRPLVFNDDDLYFWGIPDSQILEPFQKEINEARTQIQRHRRATSVKIVAKTGAIEPNEASKFVTDIPSAVVFSKGSGALRDNIMLMQNGTIPPELMNSMQEIMQEVRETVGFSRNQFGEYNSRSGDTTATEAQIVRMASEIRVDERRDLTADLLTEVFEVIHQIIFQHWTEQDVVDIVGPGGVPVWVQFRGELLSSGRYNVKVDPDSALPETRALREQKAVQMYEILKTNPFIDPVKLTQMLLHEMSGTQFDDLMVMMPTPTNAVPGQETNVQGLMGMIQNSMGQMQNGAQPNRPQITDQSKKPRGKPQDGAGNAGG